MVIARALPRREVIVALILASRPPACVTTIGPLTLATSSFVPGSSTLRDENAYCDAACAAGGAHTAIAAASVNAVPTAVERIIRAIVPERAMRVN